MGKDNKTKAEGELAGCNTKDENEDLLVQMMPEQQPVSNGTSLLQKLHNNNSNGTSSSSSSSSSSGNNGNNVLNNNSCTAATQIMLNGFAKNLTISNSINFAQNSTVNDKFSGSKDNINKNNNNFEGYVNVTDIDLPGLEAPKKVSNVKLHLPSPMYDRYPKSVGTMKVYPITTPDKEEPPPGHTHSTLPTDKQLEDMKREEQERLDEILLICTEYEKQNQTPTMIGSASPIVQNRIKTNGSLPREKKTLTTSPTTPNGTYDFNVQGLDGMNHLKHGHRGSEYENISGDQRRQMNLPLKDAGYENVLLLKKNVPQSPRTRIKTCISPKREEPTPAVPVIPANHANEYEAIIKSFEEKLEVEIKMLQSREPETAVKERLPDSNDTSKSSTSSSSNKSDTLLDRQRERSEIIKVLRHLKTMIADLQNQEEEVMREMDVEKALVNAELAAENQVLQTYERDLSKTQANLHRAEAQRNSNRVMQETNQAKLKQAIDVKQEHLKRLENLLENDKENQVLIQEREKVTEEIDNDIKIFEDLEFQYFEEETEWLQQRDEMQKEILKLTTEIEAKHKHIAKLKTQDTESHASACLDTKQIEKQIFELSKDLEVNRERLKIIDKEIFEISGHEIEHTDTEEEENDVKMPGGNLMSQSLFGSQELLPQQDAKTDLMSKSMNENLLLTNIESGKRLEFTSTPIRHGFDMNKEISELLKTKGDKLREADSEHVKKLQLYRRSNENVSDPLLKLKYNLNPVVPPKPPKPARHIPIDDKCELSLSLDDDNFTVNPSSSDRTASQDDIDRISKITNDSPLVSIQGASDKVKESIKEIEKNRQLLLAQQGTHLIDYEKRKVQELKKRSQDEAKAKYLEQQRWTNSLPRNIDLTRAKPVKTEIPYLQYQRQQQIQGDRTNERPLSEVNSECSFEGNFLQDMSISVALAAQNHSTPQSKKAEGESPDAGANSLRSENRNSMQSENSSEDVVIRRNIAKHQRPLTRYLPIFSDLNLREHIESAGHQIALCPHVFVDRTTCKGYLHKIGNYFGWSKRWFVLDREKRAFIYYTDKAEKKPRGGAYFNAIDEVYLDYTNVSKSSRPHSTFIVKTKKRSYHLQAPSDAAARIWIDAIITGAQGNLASEYYDY